MTAPTRYSPATDFSAYGSANPTTPQSGASLDAEFAAIQTSLTETQDNLDALQRSDGLLANGTVHPDAFTAASLSLMGGSWTPKGVWVTATEYAIGDVVEDSGFSYVCAVAHVAAASFSTDDASGYWIGISGGTAAVIAFTPAGDIAATDVQAAIEELDTEKQPLDAGLTSIAGLTTAADKMIYATASDTYATTDLTAAARGLLDDASVSAMLTTLTAAGLANDNVFTGTNSWKQGSDVASATAVTLGSGNTFTITGATTIETFSSKGVGTIVFLRFASALTLTHNATDLVLPTGANITTAANDWLIMEEYASGDWRVVSYMRASGLPLVNPTGFEVQYKKTDITSASTATPTANTLTDISGVTLTMNSSVTAGNHVIIDVHLTVGRASAGNIQFAVLRDSTVVTEGAAASSRTQITTAVEVVDAAEVVHMHFQYRDTGAGGSAHVYKVQWTSTDGAALYLNRSDTDTDAAAFHRAASWIEAREIQQ